MGTKRAGRDARVDRCPTCGSWRLKATCRSCSYLDAVFGHQPEAQQAEKENAS